LTLRARRSGDDVDCLAHWERVLQIRPSSVEAWEQSATVCARAGLTEEAHARYERALELSPTHPRILRNHARLECTQGDLQLGLELIERLRALGCLAPGWSEGVGEELVLELGAPERGARLVFGRELAALVPEQLHARAQSDAEDAEASECLAQLLWARAHAADGNFEVALRNYRQAAERSRERRGPEGGAAPPYALELAAAELRAGRREDALGRAQGIPPLHPAAFAELPHWVREVLPELGLASPEQAR
jgi:Flp pilus assembly protein TadD